jgi:aminopeptidase N
VEIFEHQLRRPYPFEKLDIVAAPQWPSGATELSAAITYREERILVGDDPAPGARLALLGVHAHELSHMWFGNLVTPPWWDDLWLKEGFATWSTPLVLTIFEPEGGHELNAAVSSIGAMRLDSLASTRSIRQPITENSNIRNAYDAITYSKSLGVIHMVDQYFGPEKFRPALGRYIEAFADGVADSPAFYKIIGEQTNTPELTETFRTFVEQKGVPQLDLALVCTDQSPPMVSIRQSRYKPLGSPIPESDVKWSIPVCLRSSDGPEQCLMLADREQEVALKGSGCPQWILPNARGSGYYRWSLEQGQWQSLVDHFSQLSGVESLSVIDSAFAAFEAGTLSQDLLLELIGMSAKAGQRQVVLAPLTFLRKYRRNYVTSSDSSAFLEFARTTYQPVLQRTAGSEDSDDQLIYSELLSFMALTAQDSDVRKLLLKQARAFTGIDGERDSAALTSDQYQAALIVAVQDGGEEFLTHLIEVRTEIDDPLFESSSASAIGRINYQERLEQVHQLAVSGQLGSREVFGLVDSLLAEPTLREQNWQWLRDNFAEVVAKLPEQWRRHTPRFGRTFCGPEKQQELRQLFEDNGDLVAGYAQILAQTEEQIQLCIGLRERGQAFSQALSAL